MGENIQKEECTCVCGKFPRVYVYVDSHLHKKPGILGLFNFFPKRKYIITISVNNYSSCSTKEISLRIEETTKDVNKVQTIIDRNTARIIETFEKLNTPTN